MAIGHFLQAFSAKMGEHDKFPGVFFSVLWVHCKQNFVPQRVSIFVALAIYLVM